MIQPIPGPESVRPARPLTLQTLTEAAAALATRDPELAAVLKQHGPPPMWGRTPGFVTLVRIILEQQVSLISARSMFKRLTANIKPFTPERFIELGGPYLRSLGVTRQKAAYFLALAEAMATGELLTLARLSDHAAREALMRVKGIGPWTADIYLLMVLKRPDIWPNGDIALATAVMNLKQLKARPSFPQLEQTAQNWRPFRSVAARMLWQYYLANR
ncbi:MAG: HhH-GPD family protein [Acidobacteria bacterium]|nr:HhH-GPD family protein [Acidobacteriota bacterium]